MLTMKLLIYAAPSSTVGRDLRKRINSTRLETGAETAYCNSMSALEKHLRKPLGISPVGILIPSDDDELAALIGMRHLLSGMRLILILPSSLQPNFAHARAHMLRPRFITSADKNLEEVTAVLWKIKDSVCAAAV
jgi:hypothetical protein